MKDIAAKYLEPYEFGGANMLNSAALIKPINAAKNQYDNVNRNTIKRLRTKSGIYIGQIKTKSGDVINDVWQRPVQKKSANARKKSQTAQPIKSPLKLLFVFDDAHEATQHWEYFDRADKIINRNFNKVLGKQIAKALAITNKG